MVKIRCIVGLWLLLLCLASSAIGADRPADLRIEGSGEHYWVCLVNQDPNDPKNHFTSVRMLVDKASGKWSQIAQLQSQVVDVAAVGDRLAILSASGDWQLVWRGGSVLGPGLPQDRVATRFAGDGQTLLAITRAAKGPPALALYRWNHSAGWRKEADLPPEATPAQSSVAAYKGVPWIAYAGKDAIEVGKLQDGAWQRVCSLDRSRAFELISGAPAAMLARHGSDGRISVYDVHTDRPAEIQSLELPEPNDTAVVDTSLRFVTTDGVTIKQTRFDQFGRGAKSGPDEIARLDTTAQREHEWVNVVVVALLTLAMLATFRQRPAGEAIDVSKVMIAPLSRRIPAAVIDAIPLLIANAWLYSRTEGGTITPDQVSASLYAPEFIGLGLYLLHVTLSEIVFGRSIGKLMFGLRVVTPEGTRVPAGRIVLRNILRIIDLALVLPIFFVFISPASQRIGDLAARTLVVKDDSLEAQPKDVEEPPQDIEPPAPA
ncbi:MAG: RDD family protein [Tepidisphaeraceae bacterium]